MSDLSGSVAPAAGGPAAPPTDMAGPQAGRLKKRRQVPELAALVVVLLALCVFFSLRSEFFLNWDNWLNILIAVSITGIIAAPATMLIIAGQFDLSVGSALTFCGIVMAYTAERQGILVAVLATIMAGLLVGALNGFLVTVVGVNALITTLGTLAAFAGLARLLADGQTLILDDFGTLGTTRIFFRIPIGVVIFLGVVLLFYLTMRYTVFGRSMYAIGANPVAARLSGIRSNRLIFFAFLLSGLCVTLGALINVSQLGAASTLAGNGVELSVVTAVILGGASLAGGRGTILGTMLGLLIIGVLNNGLVLMNIDAFWQDVARGTLLILAVSFDQLRLRLGTR